MDHNVSIVNIEDIVTYSGAIDEQRFVTAVL